MGLKARVLARLGTVLARRGVRTNWRFAGVLPLDRPEAAIAELSRLLDRAEARAAAAPGEIWVMVHPGAPGDPVQIAGHSPALRGLEADLLRERHTGR